MDDPGHGLFGIAVRFSCFQTLFPEMKNSQAIFYRDFPASSGNPVFGTVSVSEIPDRTAEEALHGKSH